MRMTEETLQPAPAQSNTVLLIIASIGCALTVLDSNVVAVVLPTIGRQFNASFAGLEWVISTYVLCFASLLLAAGSLADRFGRRRVFIAGLAAFGVTSFLCGAAATAQQLIIARACQGLGAAFMLAPALALIAHGFVDERERNRAWAIWGSVMGLTMVLAPSTGGLIARLLDWRWTFYLNVPICLGLVVAALCHIPESRQTITARIDLKGMLSFSATMLCLVWYLISGPSQGWVSTGNLVVLGAAGLGLSIFIAVERSQARPMLDLGLFRDARLVGAVWSMFAYAACAQVMATFLPQVLQNGFGLVPLDAGLAMLPFGFTMLIFPHIGRMMDHRLPGDRKLMLGLAIVSLGNAIMAAGTWRHSWALLGAGMLVLGAGGGLLNGETQKAIMRHIPHERAGMASGISTTARFSGILIGFAVLSGLLASSVRVLLRAVSPNASWADAIVAGHQGVLVGAAPDVLASAHAAYLQGVSTALGFASILAAASCALVWRLLRA